MARVEPQPQCEPRQERTVLFSDIVASTALLDRLGDDVWIRLLDHHRRSMSAVVLQHHGSVVGFCGDGFMALFDSPGDGLLCALRLQYALTVQAELGVRIGVSTGPVIPYLGDYVGLTVHVASRLTDLSRRGEVLLTEKTYESARRCCPVPRLTRRTVAVRGLERPQVVRASEPLEDV